MLKQFSKYQIATSIAVFFHCIGLAGILWGNRNFFVEATAINLLLSFALLLWTQQEKNSYFFLFIAACICIGIGVELIGVNTSALFGRYEYGNVLGYKIKNVPLIIGINWFVVIYCCGVSIYTMIMRMLKKLETETKLPRRLRGMSLIIDGATLAVFFDWILEPVAVKLGYWKWKEEEIPFFNYLSWFLVSMLLLTLFHFCKFNKHNKFAVHLLLIQILFFLLLRTFL